TVTTDLPVNAGGDTRIQVFTGTCNQLLCKAGDDDAGTGNLSTTTFNVTAGVTYYIAFDDRWNTAGFQFSLIENVPVAMHASFTMQPVATVGFYSSCVVDMNGDHLDDIVSVQDANIRINQQLAVGGFTDLDVPAAVSDHEPSWSICAGDLDGNGLNDLCYAGGGGVTFMMANDDGTAYSALSQPEDIFCQRSNMVDINDDGKLDVFVCHDVAPNVYYTNNGNNTFTSHQGGLGDTPDGGNYGSIWIDYDNDGDMDMFIAKCRGGNSVASIDQLHRNNGDGTFTEIANTMNLADHQQSWSSAWGDYDNDGDLDILIGASSFTGGGHKLMRNDGGTFTNVTVGSGFDLFTGTNVEHVTHDFDNDGWLDVFGGDNTILFNRGNMTFEPNVIPAGHGPIGDLNNDGYLDIVSFGDLYLNDGGDNHYIKINTIGTTSNQNGIGARIQVTSALGTQIREVRSGDGFEFMSSLTAHFGLGNDTEVEQVVVHWPSGITDVVNDPAVDGTLNIVEGSTNSTSVVEALSADLALYPVPAEHTLNIRSTQDLTNAPVTITDVTGKVVLRTVLRNGQFDVSELTSGAYLLQVQYDGHLLKRTFTKQ
ncbi:MAG TPA: FG-GAP-like repeat-containing protein, partial [Flavobacteriales bacterium]|nr:FG-GAP-like repeat-containing protein [Flavobacteriales bacterium]